MNKLLGIAAIGAALMTTSAARADGLATRASALPADARASLEKQITELRVSHPEAFDAVKGVRGYHIETYGKFRNPKPHVGSELRTLGAAALLPMLDELAFAAPARGSSTEEELQALTVGLLEAVGRLRDPRSGPVLRAIFDGNPGGEVSAAAARAMGRLAGDAELADLVKHTGEADPERGAAIQGLGECRRVESAKALASMLATAKDDATATAIAKAFGSLGSSWAWKAMGPAAESAGLAVRAIAAKALVPTFVSRTGDARSAVGKAIVMLGHPDVPGLIANVRPSADASTQRDLDGLAELVQKSLGQ